MTTLDVFVYFLFYILKFNEKMTREIMGIKLQSNPLGRFTLSVIYLDFGRTPTMIVRETSNKGLFILERKRCFL